MLTFPKIQWSGKRDSNPRPSAWKADALANWAIPAFETNLFLGVNMVERGGFEPPKAEPADLQSAPFGHSGTSPQWGSLSILPWSQRRESNPRPTDYKSVALPSELRWLYDASQINNQYNF